LDDLANPDCRDWWVARDFRAVSLWTRLPMTDDLAVARPVEAPARVDLAAVAVDRCADVLRAGVALCRVVRAGV